MKLNKAKLAVAVVLVAASWVAHGQSVTLSISGRITSTPCTVSVDTVVMGEREIARAMFDQVFDKDRALRAG